MGRKPLGVGDHLQAGAAMRTEAEVLDALVIPAPPKRWCSVEGCKTPLAQLNGETMCFRHQQEERRKKVMDSFASCDRSNELGAGLFRPLMPRQRPSGEKQARGRRPLPPSRIARPPHVEPPAVEVEEPKKEEVTPVTEPKQEQYRECAVKDCKNVVAPHNKTGRCQGHYNLRRGMQMKDGSIPRPHSKLSQQMALARIENAATGKTGRKCKKTLAAPTTLATEEEIRSAPTEAEPPEPLPEKVEGGWVSLQVRVDALDRFLLHLSVEDKARIVERELLGA